jgi:hypothetical protein
MVDDFVLLGYDKASYPTEMDYKNILLESHDLPVLTNGACTYKDKNRY